MLLAACLFSGFVVAMDFSTLSGKTYRNARVSRINVDSIVIFHDGGIATIPIHDLSEAQKVEYGLSEEKAKAAKLRAIAEENARIQRLLGQEGEFFERKNEMVPACEF